MQNAECRMMNERPKERPRICPNHHSSFIIHRSAEADAEACFLKAIDTARQQQAKSLELRAVMSLVRLRQQQVTQAR